MLNQKIFQNHFQEICPDHLHKKFLLAVSGGVDSMVLLHLFTNTNIPFEAAHINYGLRGDDSLQDQRVVQETCREYGIKLHLYQVTEEDNKPNNSIQEWARDLRYRFFREVLENSQLDLLVTAHHLNDQLETFLINLSKAAGLAGLCGIPEYNQQIIRPLLVFTKQEIYHYAAVQHLTFREDLSNRKNEYLRNRIRNEVVPELLTLNSHFLENFGKSQNILRQTKEFVQQQLEKIKAEITTQENELILINRGVLPQQTDFIRYEILSEYGFREPVEINKIIGAAAGKKFHSATHELVVDRDHLIITVSGSQPGKTLEEITVELNENNHLILPDSVKRLILKNSGFHWKIDAAKVVLPLKIRRKQDGDTFQPIGMIGKKKIAKFFKDEKIPILAQQNIWILCDGEGQILGVMPLRQDRRAAAHKKSTDLIIINVTQ